MLDKIISLLLSNELQNVDGLLIEGAFNFPKKILVDAIAADFNEKQAEADDSNSNVNYGALINYLHLDNFSISFEEETVRLKINIHK